MNTKYTHIVSSDLDGTLICKGDDLSPENYAAISEMKKRGICFVVNTGRTISEMPRSVIEHPDIRYYIGSDGSVIWDKETDTYTEIAMSREEFAPVFDLLLEYGTVDTVRSGGRSYANKAQFTPEIYEKTRVSKLYAAFIDYYVDMVDNYEEFIRGLDSVEMVCSFFSNDKDMDECAKKVEAMGSFIVAASEPTNIEIFHKKAGKGGTLLKLADMLGIPHENTIAVGDSMNDMDMLGKAGLSLAMANATDQLKAAAHKVICPCEEHSARYILTHFF